ncbi:hypothetical protein [Burkholderia ubonensis]|uniref:hypothetical protein n=1 Tax=Burkholderia ubonensis TaxID=101571 RepID=UPI0012F836B5|nr:hypothetical protein [Burkholderia ubonensis]
MARRAVHRPWHPHAAPGGERRKHRHGPIDGGHDAQISTSNFATTPIKFKNISTRIIKTQINKCLKLIQKPPARRTARLPSFKHYIPERQLDKRKRLLFHLSYYLMLRRVHTLANNTPNP